MTFFSQPAPPEGNLPTFWALPPAEVLAGVALLVAGVVWAVRAQRGSAVKAGA